MKKNILSHLRSSSQKMMKKLNSQFTLPLEGRFALVLAALSNREKQIFFAAMGVLVGSTIIILVALNQSFLVARPASGGTLIEGVLNTPAHINPLLATGETGSSADRDIAALVYSGLLRSDGDGGFVPDLAESYNISPNGLTYTFVLRPDLVWHDGKPVSASDVVFTIKTAQDSRIKSAKRANWDGVGVELVDERTVRFTLAQPYAPFLENATMGILPEHIWKSVDYNRFDTNKYNREPIGTGPYKFSSLNTTTQDGDEIPVSYTLKAFKSFALGEPHIATIKFVFYHNEEELVSAVQSGEVDAINGVSPENARVLEEHGYRVLNAPLPRVLAVFFNQGQTPVFSDSAVRKALALTVDKQNIINKALAGYGVILDGAIPPGAVGYQEAAHEAPRDERVAAARKLLEKAGWKWSEESKNWSKVVKKEKQILQFELTTSEATELKTVAQELKASWEDFGISVTVRVFATGDLKETIVRPRKFDALFFGQVLGRDGDPYPFWHSSQRLDPGLNIASYVNTRVDKLLEAARIEPNTSKRATAYKTFRDEIAKDTPAVFLYAPEFLYVVPKDVRGLTIGSISAPSERFLNIYEWYTETDYVWKIFAS